MMAETTKLQALDATEARSFESSSQRNHEKPKTDADFAVLACPFWVRYVCSELHVRLFCRSKVVWPMK